MKTKCEKFTTECIQNEKKVLNTDINKLNWRFNQIFFSDHKPVFMVEDAARLDFIKDKVAKRTEEIISHAECEKSVQICVRSHELLVHQSLDAYLYCKYNFLSFVK